MRAERRIDLLTRLRNLRCCAARARLALLNAAAASDRAAAKRAEKASLRLAGEAEDYAMRRFAQGKGSLDASSFVEAVTTGSALAKRRAALTRLQHQRLARAADASEEEVDAQRRVLTGLERRVTGLGEMTRRLAARTEAGAELREEDELSAIPRGRGFDGTP